MNNTFLSKAQSFLPDLLLLLCTVVWGLSFTILKIMLAGQISLFFFVFLRFFVSALLLLIFFRKNLARMNYSGIKAGVFLGILVFGGFITQTLGIETTTASKSAFLTGLSAIFVPICLIIHKRRLPEPLLISAIVLAAFGMYLLTNPAGGSFNYGDFQTILCAVIFGIMIYSVGILSKKFDTIGLSAVEIITTAVLSATLLPFEKIQIILSAGTIAAILFLVLFATVGGLTIQMWAQKRIPAVRAGLIFTAEPVFAYMFASAILGEHFNFIQKLGGAIIIIAVLSTEVLARLLPRREQIDPE